MNPGYDVLDVKRSQRRIFLAQLAILAPVSGTFPNPRSERRGHPLRFRSRHLARLALKDGDEFVCPHVAFVLGPGNLLLPGSGEVLGQQRPGGFDLSPRDLALEGRFGIHQCACADAIEPPLLGADAIDERANLVGDEVIDLDRDAAAAGGAHQLRSLLDRLRSARRGRLPAHAAAGAIDRRACLTECPGDPAPGLEHHNATFSDIVQGDLSNDGVIAFRGAAVFPGQQLNSTIGIWWDMPGKLSLVAALGEPIPDIDGVLYEDNVFMFPHASSHWDWILYGKKYWTALRSFLCGEFRG